MTNLSTHLVCALKAIPIAISLMAGSVLAQATVDFSSAAGTGVSASEVLINGIRVSVPVINPFNPSTSTTATTTYDVRFRFDPVTLHLVPIGVSDTATGRCSSVSVTVTDALRGQLAPISGATVNISGQTATTNAQGVATFSNGPSGLVTVSVTAPNFVIANQPATLSCATTNSLTVSLSPSTGTGALTAGSFRVILNWGLNPEDVDAHMTGPSATTDRWHVFYGAQTAGDVCGLDVDDTTSYGPETITCPRTGSLSSLRPGIYRYSLHHYWGIGNLGSASASVRLELPNGQFYSYTPPATASYTGVNDVWTVFELTVNANGTMSIAPVNSIQNNVSDVSVRSATSHTPDTPPLMGQREDMKWFSNLPTK